MLILSRVTETLPCRLTEAEWMDRAKTLARVATDCQQEEKKQKDIKAHLKAAIESLEAKRQELATVVTTGEEYRDVEVEDRGDGALAIVQRVRTDTGEVLHSRPMTEQERQDTLPFPASDETTGEREEAEKTSRKRGRSAEARA